MALFDFAADDIDDLRLGDMTLAPMDDGTWTVQLFTSRFAGEFVNCGAWFILSPPLVGEAEAATWHADDAGHAMELAA